MEQWLRDLSLAPKSKVHIRSLMPLVLKCVERWGAIELGKNPVTLVRVKNASKRLKWPQILTGAKDRARQRKLLVKCRIRIVWDHLGLFPPQLVPAQ